MDHYSAKIYNSIDVSAIYFCHQQYCFTILLNILASAVWCKNPSISDTDSKVVIYVCQTVNKHWALTESRGRRSGHLDLGPPDFKTFSADRSRRTDKPATSTILNPFSGHTLYACSRRGSLQSNMIIGTRQVNRNVWYSEASADEHPALYPHPLITVPNVTIHT